MSDFDSPPIPLTRSSDPQPFPVDALPATVGLMVQAVAHATQTDPAMAATSALSVLAACAGGHAEVEIRRGWREPLCLYTVTVAGPGERKSAVQAALTRPVLDVEHRLAEAGAHSRLEAETLKQIAIRDAERTRNAAASAKPEDKSKLQADAIGAVATAESITVPVIPRLVADDVTPEAAATLLADQGGRLAILSAEGGVFDIIAGRYSKSIPNMDLWLKGHSGDPIKVDRKGRPPEYIRRPALTLGLMVQPSVLTEIARQPSFRGRGLLARILYAMPASKVGSRKIAPDPVPPEIEGAYEKLIGELAEGLAGWSGDPAMLMLTPEAGEAVRQLEFEVEPTLAGSGSLASLADWGAKYVGAVVRIAGLLHLAQHGHDRGIRESLNADTVNDAVQIGDYYRACAIQAFDVMQTDQATADAAYLAEKLSHIDGDTVSARDLHRASRGRFKTRADLEPALTRLVEHDYLQPLPMPEKSTAGRPPSPLYEINNLWTERTERTQVDA